MPNLKEYRIVLPLSLEEYRIGQLYCVIEQSKRTTGGGDGVEWHINRPYNNYPLFGGKCNSGQFTRKTYHVKNKIPRIIRAMMAEKSCTIEEKAYNSFPYCRVELKPGLTPEKFNIYIETIHLADRGETENAFNLSPEMLAKREVINVDIVNDQIPPTDYKPDEDPTTFQSKDGRGPWKGADWRNTCEPFMCCYKLVYIECNWMTGRMVENHMAKQYPRMFNIFHRLVVCKIDSWRDLTIEDIRKMEEEAMQYLNQQLNQGQLKGPAAIE